MSVSLSWDSLWALFDRAETYEKQQIWQQLDLEHFLRGLDAKHQIEVLKKAPKEIIKLVENHLYLETKLALSPMPQTVQVPTSIKLVKAIRGY